MREPSSPGPESPRAKGAAITVRGITEGPVETKGEPKVDERMRRLERRANIIRSRLLRTIDVLDERRRQIARAGQRAKSFAGSVVLGVAGAALVAGIGVFLLARALRARRRPSLPDRVSRVASAARRVRPPSLGRRLLERVLLTCASIVASELAKRGSRNVLDGRTIGGRLLPPPTAIPARGAP